MVAILGLVPGALNAQSSNEQLWFEYMLNYSFANSYNLENAFNDKSGFLINKIKVTPKRDSEPAMTGYIYIVDGTWEIYAVNLSIKGLLINTPLVDNLKLKIAWKTPFPIFTQ